MSGLIFDESRKGRSAKSQWPTQRLCRVMIFLRHYYVRIFRAYQKLLSYKWCVITPIYRKKNFSIDTSFLSARFLYDEI